MEMNQSYFDNNENDQSEPVLAPTKQQINETLTKCYLLTGLAKLKGITQYVRDIIENECKFLIFAHHIEVMDGIEAELTKLKLKYIRIDGSTSMNKRHELVQQFQEVPEIRIALLSISATGVGLTLTAASTILFTEMHWTPAMMLQAEDRAHRIGQVNSVNCHYLYGSGTLDDRLYLKLDQKLGIVSEMIDGLRKDLEVEDNLKKGDMGAISMNKILNAPKVKSSSSAFHNEKKGSAEKSSEKITDFFEVIGQKKSQVQMSSEKAICSINVNTISTIQKENHSDYSDMDLPDLELLDKLVDEYHNSNKKVEILENKRNEDVGNKNIEVIEKKIPEIIENREFNIFEKKDKEEKKIPEKNKKNFTIDKFRQVFQKEFTNNLIDGEELCIDDSKDKEISLHIGDDSNNSVIFTGLINFNNETKLKNEKNNNNEDKKSNSRDNSKTKRSDNVSLRKVYEQENEKGVQNPLKFKKF